MKKIIFLDFSEKSLNKMFYDDDGQDGRNTKYGELFVYIETLFP